MGNKQIIEKNSDSGKNSESVEKFDVINFTKKHENNNKTSLSKQKKYETTTLEEDIFDEDGNLAEDDSQVNNIISNLKVILSVYFNKVFNLIEKISNKTFNPLIKLANNLINLANNLVKSFSKLVKKTETEEEKNTNNYLEEENEPLQEEEASLGTFSKARDLNITFLDNYDMPLYKVQKNNMQPMTKNEESLVIEMAITAIKECAEFTIEMPPPTEGIYKGRSIYELMSNISPEELALFLGYVNGIPKRYVGHSWKISETYATWLISNAPLYVDKGK
ncbi:MAG: hypothetical protein U0457_06000 [Candidatus Sericytochromatia bacterium]